MTKLNLFLVAVLSSVSVSAAFANDDLAKIMDDMNANMKTITKQAPTASQNASSASLCDKVIADVAQAATLIPDTIAKLSSDQAAQAQQGYVTAMGQLSDQLTTLKADFVSGNNAGAVSQIAVINATKAAGHQQFQ